MPELDKIDKIEIRSEEVQEVLGASPRWIIRAGISVIFLVVLIFVTGSWFFKYPDIIQSNIILTTQNPPASLKALATGKITDLFAEEKQQVKQNEVIAIIENTTNYQDEVLLKSMLDTLQNIEYFNIPKDLKLQKSQEESRQQIAIEEALENLKSQINRWEQTYLIISPIDGIVTFTKIWSKNQNVQTGEIVATVIPNDETNIIGKVEIPPMGVGKVKNGQTVNIKLNNFPHMEFGLLKGKVKSISLIPETTQDGIIYTAEIEIPKTLISNYGKELKFSQEMTGIAEIITEDIRLLERFLYPLKSIWEKNVE